jgi:hypothetical protein
MIQASMARRDTNIRCLSIGDDDLPHVVPYVVMRGLVQKPRDDAFCVYDQDTCRVPLSTMFG